MQKRNNSAYASILTSSMMKQIFYLFIMTIFISSGNSQLNGQNMNNDKPVIQSPDPSDKNNNFYDNEETYSLGLNEIEVAGEVENPGWVDLSKLSKHSVIVKETLLKGDSDVFVGAYRYDGYSLFDILNDRILKKKNEKEFRPIIDVYIEIENKKGEKVIVSWGEIYYTNFLHNAIIATDIMRIVPSKTKDLWPLPDRSKLVIANDLLSERNIPEPVKITVKSCDRSFPVNREMDPLFSPEIKVYDQNDPVMTVRNEIQDQQKETLHTIFYGKGRGIHSTQPFTGYFLKTLFSEKLKITQSRLRNGIFLIVGIDGYRSVYTYSEIMNRNDQAEVLLVPCKDVKDGGAWRIFPSCDFFSDRAVKAVSGIYLLNSEIVK